MRKTVAAPSKIYADRVAGKAVIYLDTNAWSDVSEAKTREAQAARKLALEAHARGLAIFPLAFPPITELLHRESNADSIAQAELMDTLSDGVAFRGTQHIREAEVRVACDFLLTGKASSPVKHVFTVTPCYISDTSVVFPEAWTEKSADEFMSKLEQFGFPGMRWLQDHMRQPQYLDHNSATDDKYVSDISRKRDDALVWSADRSGKPNVERLRREEHQAVLHGYILGHVLRVTTPSEFVRLLPKLQSLQTDAKGLRAVVSVMPSTWLSCEMHVQVVLAKSRRTTTQDFYDHENAVLAMPYTNAFVTSDGGILDLLRRAGAAKRFDCRAVRGMAALRTYLDTIVSAQRRTSFGPPNV